MYLYLSGAPFSCTGTAVAVDSEPYSTTAAMGSQEKHMGWPQAARTADPLSLAQTTLTPKLPVALLSMAPMVLAASAVRNAVRAAETNDLNLEEGQDCME